MERKVVKIETRDVFVEKDWKHLAFTAKEEGSRPQRIDLTINSSKKEYTLISAKEEGDQFAGDTIQEGILKLRAMDAALAYLWDLIDSKNDYPFIEKALRK
jgi:hypothetical protein